MRLTARPERQWRRSGQERPALEIGLGHAERLSQGRVPAAEPVQQLPIGRVRRQYLFLGRLRHRVQQSLGHETARPAVYMALVAEQVTHLPAGTRRHRGS
jgi:hypothetical protein